MISELHTQRLILRPWRQSDREPFALMNADPAVMEFFPTCLSRSESDAAVDWIEDHFRQHGFGIFAVELLSEQAFIGFTGLSVPRFEAHFTPCVEIGWRLAKAYWGRGLATEAARAALAHGFDVIGLKEIVSFTTTANVRSRSVMQKLGMKHDPADDFDHPGLPEGHPLRRHVLYRLSAKALG
jgi:RimJ/RimL family protein N-acetyltransferase